MTAQITITDKLKCAERELAMRRNVYPKWVASGKMTKDKTDREIAVMAAIVDDYVKMALKER